MLEGRGATDTSIPDGDGQRLNGRFYYSGILRVDFSLIALSMAANVPLLFCGRRVRACSSVLDYRELSLRTKLYSEIGCLGNLIFGGFALLTGTEVHCPTLAMTVYTDHPKRRKKNNPIAPCEVLVRVTVL